MSAATAGRAGRALGRLLRAAVAAVVAAAALFAGGFLWFVASVPADEVALQRGADGIVALTGGASRIVDAMELLAAGRGKRLLISGVHPGTTTGGIARTVPEYGRLLVEGIEQIGRQRPVLQAAVLQPQVGAGPAVDAAVAAYVRERQRW